MKLKPWTDENASKLLNSFNGSSIPLLLYLDKDGIEIDRIVGYYPADEYLKKHGIQSADTVQEENSKKADKGRKNPFEALRALKKDADNEE